MSTRCTDHPRSRGEYLPRGARSGRPGGSSPLSRGIRHRQSERQATRRIIPALAGNTATGRSYLDANGDHPRSRGEYMTIDDLASRTGGSSPLSRGIHPTKAPNRDAVRIIPALAGNTRGIYSTQPGTSDHPRSRGEYSAGAAKRMRLRGSSPLSRGILGDIVNCTPRSGIIPALAGNTCRHLPGVCWRVDHPRSRGEYGPYMLSERP